MTQSERAIRVLALFVALATLLGLLPQVAFFESRAEEAPLTETYSEAATESIDQSIAAARTTVENDFANILVPITHKATFNSGDFNQKNINAMDGVYFMLGISTLKNSNDQYTYATFNFRSHEKRKWRLYEDTGTGLYYTFASQPATLSGYTVATINGAPIRNLDNAVQLVKYTGDIKSNNTYSQTYDNVVYKGWAGRLKFECQYSNATYSNGKAYGDVVDLPYVPSDSNRGAPYKIKSLHPENAGRSYLYYNLGTQVGCAINFGTYEYPWFFMANRSNDNSYYTNSVKIYKMDHTGGSNASGDNSHLTYWLAWDQASNQITTGDIPKIVRNDRHANNSSLNKRQFNMNWNFFQVSPAALDLYYALREAEVYVSGNKADGNYPKETYLNFLKFVHSAYGKYETYRQTFSTDAKNPVRVESDALAKDIRSYIALLEIESKPGTYIDIPMEVLDFRADGLLFEDWNHGTAYSLSSGSMDLDANHPLPGTAQPSEGNLNSYYMEGLIKDKLVNGNIVYTRETVEYIATALHMQHHTFSDPGLTVDPDNYRGDWDADDMDPYYNKAFMKLVDSNTGNRASTAPVNPLPLGDYDSTILSTDTKQEGGILSFDQVNDCYDLAYYMLSNLWRETSSKDIVETVVKDGKTFDLPYNLKVKEYSAIRLLSDGEGNYTFASDKENGRVLDSGLIFNHNLTTDAQAVHPKLNAVADLGFEHPTYLGNNSTGGRDKSGIRPKHNYHAVFHIRGAFVYYEHKNLKFSFTGDDDVYFFINGELVSDIGGMHPAVQRSKELNGAVAQKLKLKDGDICIFDMFLAERHSSAINLNLTTNIDMVPVGALTDKSQYHYEGPGLPGEEIREGAVVADQTEVGYGFLLYNRSLHGVQHLTFDDPALNVELSDTKVDLGGYARPDELTFVYTAFDSVTNRLSEKAPRRLSYEEIYAVISEGVDDLSTVMPLEEEAYYVTGLTADQIRSLLSLGLPACVRLGIYGFHRTAHASVGSYPGTVNTSCLPISHRGEDGTYVYLDPINGIASRSFKVKALDGVTTEPFRIVIDYGKPVEFTIEELFECLSYDRNNVAITFMGLRRDGVHGSTLDEKPVNQYLLTDFDTFTTDNGTYDRFHENLRFSPKGMLESVERVYAVFQIRNRTEALDWYLMTAVEIIPATLMYYEAEDLMKAEELSYKEKTTEILTETVDGQQVDRVIESYHEQFTLVGETPEMKPVPQGFDMEKNPNCIFIGFDATTESAARYASNSVYGGANFDQLSSYYGLSYAFTPSLSIGNGMLSYSGSNPNHTMNYFRLTSSSGEFNGPMRYFTKENDWVEVRLKVNYSGTDSQFSDGRIVLQVEYLPNYGDGTDSPVSYFEIPISDCKGEKWLVFKSPADQGRIGLATRLYHEINMVRGITLCFNQLQKGTSISATFDYLYLGPEEGCPSNQPDEHLYFGFDNGPADKHRYLNAVYDYTHNYDVASSWTYDSSLSTAPTVEGGALKLSVLAGKTSAWVQTGASLNYSAPRSELARAKVKFANATATGKPVARFTVMTDGSLLPDGSYPYVDVPITSEQLASNGYVTLSGILEEAVDLCGGKHVTGVRLSFLNITGTVYVDELVIGPKVSQDPDSYAPAESLPKFVEPQPAVYHMKYDDSVLFFGFDDKPSDRERYNYRSQYGGSNRNYDQASNWHTDGSVSIGNGILVNKVDPPGSNTWGHCGTGPQTGGYDDAGRFTLNHRVSPYDWVELRVRINGSSNSDYYGLDMEFMSTPGSSATTTKAKVWNKIPKASANQWVLVHFPLDDSHCDSAMRKYRELGTLKRINIYVGNVSSTATYTLEIDYLYVGPNELRPSQLKPDHIYLGFENSHSNYKFNSPIYGNTNFEIGTNWRVDTSRSGSPIIENGYLTTTVTKETPWFETQRGGGSGNCVMNFDSSTAEVLQVRLKFHNFPQAEKDVYLNAYFGVPGSTEAGVNEPRRRILIPPSDYTANDKWVTYSIKLGDLSERYDTITALRLHFENLYATNGTITVDYIYVGPDLGGRMEAYRPDEIYTYGYDSTYANDDGYSDSRSLYVEGKGVPISGTDSTVNYDGAKSYSEASFSFTGTGFDLISRTGAQQGTIRVAVYNSKDKSNDTLVKTMSVNNKGELELYQIPVVSIQGLPHDTYYVDVWINQPLTKEDLSNLPEALISLFLRGNQFYIDALRIYDPIDVTTSAENSATALDAYRTDLEAIHFIKEIRNILISKETFDQVDGYSPGAVFVDIHSSNVNPEDGTVNGGAGGSSLTSSIETYNKIGPKNEVYLAPNQAVAFRLAVDGAAALSGLDLGAKIIQKGSTGNLTIGFVKSDGTATFMNPITIATATAQYYAIDANILQILNNEEVYFIMMNSGAGEENIVSLTDIKATYGAKPESDLPSDKPTDPETSKPPESPTDPTPPSDGGSSEGGSSQGGSGSSASGTGIKCFVDGNALRAVTRFLQALYETPTDTTPTVVDGIKIYHSLDLSSDISMNYAVLKSDVEGYEDLSMCIELPAYEGNTFMGTSTLTVTPVDQGRYYYFTLSDLSAVNMNDVVTAKLSMTKDGKIYTTAEDSYSIAQYAYNQLNNPSAPEKLKILCAELLRYGAQAQCYKTYRTDALADDAMTESHRAYLGSLEDVTFGNTNRILDDVQTPSVTWVGKTLDLQSKVTVKFVFSLNAYHGDPSALSLRVSYKDLFGEAVTAVVTEPEVYQADKGQYVFSFGDLLAAELRTVLSVQIYAGEEAVSPTMEYAPDAYGNGKSGELLSLCKALLSYSDSAKNYFNG